MIPRGIRNWQRSSRIPYSLLVLLAFLCLCFTAWGDIEVDKNIPYRIYIGSDKVTEWVDVKSVGYIINGEYSILFEDDSPIEEIILDKNFNGEEFYWIIKGNSKWKFFNYGINSTLHLVEPILENTYKKVLIYKRKK